MNLPACKAEMDKFSKGLLYQIVPNKSFSNVCYTYRISNRLAGSVYRIALNDQLPEELQEWLKTIEFAHIKLQHYAKHQSLDFKFSAPKIRAVYEKLKPLFDDPVQDVDNMYDIFEDYIFKMLRDWECLTKYFTEEEVRYLDTLYPEECIIDGKPVYHMLPQDVGYPPGLTANEYLLLILQNPEEWFMNQAQAQAQANQRNRQQNNGTQGGCNTNQGSSSSGGQPDESDMNHNKEEKDKPKKNNQQQNGQNGQNGQSGQSGQNGQQNQQQNQNQNGSQNGQQNQQPQQGMGTDQQNQDAAANTQSQDWKDAKNQNENSGSQNKGGSSSNNKDGDTEDRDSQSAGSSGGQSKSDSETESGSDGVGGGSSSESEDGENKNSNGGSSSKNGESSDDESGDANSSGGSDVGGESTEDEQTANGGGNSEDGEQSEEGADANSAADETSESGEDLSGDGNESEDGSDSESEAEGDNADQSGEGGDGQDSGDDENGEDGDGDVEEPHQPTKEELEEMIKNFVQKLVTDYQKMMETKAEQSAAQNQEIAGYSRGGGGGQGTVLADGCSNWVDFEGLEKEVKELLINRSITTSKRDLLYNYNRGRGCGDVLTPRYREETRYEDVPMTVILDVSGSISEKNILGFCNIFKNVSKMVDKKCTIVLWDTELRAIFDSRDEIKAVSGGGTDIGAGINYVKKQMQPSDIGNLFVVSDCCDNLEEWNLEGFDTSYLVCWSGMNAIEQYAGNKFNEFCGQFEKILVKND